MIELPALHGDDPLGFLAGLGLLSLAEKGELPPLWLAWTGEATPVAQVEGELGSREELARRLDEVFARLCSEGRAVPEVDPGFPVRDPDSSTDPMRMAPEGMRVHFRRAADAWLEEDRAWPARWMLALATQIAVNNAKRGDVVLTPFYAPTGRMSLRVSLWDKTVEAVQAVGGPADALTGWLRTGYDGANFDHRAKRDAAVTTWGQAANQGAPSPTWLALMAMWLFPLVEHPGDVRCVGWQRVRLYPGYTRRSLVWPVWSPSLDAVAVRTLLAHPALALQPDADGGWRPADRARLTALGAHAVFGSSRATLAQGDGPLGPAVRLWPAPAAEV